MRDTRTIAKLKLKKATKTKFEKLIEESNVTEEMREIAFLKIAEKESYVALSHRFNCSVEHVRDIMAEVYDKVYEVIRSGLI